MAFKRPSPTQMLVAVALLAGGLAALGTQAHIEREVAIERERLQPEVAKTSLVVARRDLQRGDPINAQTMSVRQVPLDWAPSSGVAPEQFSAYEGAALAMPIRAGEPLVTAAIAGVDHAQFSQRLREGARAVTIAVDEVNALSGMLQPGDRIDLMLTARVADGQGDGREKTISLMQDVLILATGQQVRRDSAAGPEGAGGGERHFGAITIEVAPQQAQRLIVAQRSGRITAMLRHPEDHGSMVPAAMDVSALLGGARPARSSSTPFFAEIIVGGQGANPVPFASPFASGLPTPPAASGSGGTTAVSGLPTGAVVGAVTAAGAGLPTRAVTGAVTGTLAAAVAGAPTAASSLVEAR